MLVNKEIYFICRTCLKIGTDYFNLFNYFEDGIALSGMLVECVTVQAQEDDGLPSHICKECKTKLYSSWAFKSSALEAESRLRSNTKTMRRNDKHVIKVETSVTSTDYNFEDTVREQHLDPFTFRNDKLSTNNLEENMCNGRETPETNMRQCVAEYLGELQCKTEITVINDNNDCKTYLDSLERKSFNLEVNIDNKMLYVDTEKQNNLCINNDAKPIPNIRQLKQKLSQKLVQNKRNLKKKVNHNLRYNISRENQQTENSENAITIFTCNSCNRSFHSMKSLKIHTAKSRHIYEDQHTCQICGIEFDTVETLKAHKETHINEPHESAICKKV